MENRFLVRIQTNVNLRKRIRNNFLSEISLTNKFQNFNHQNCIGKIGNYGDREGCRRGG